VAKPIGFLGDFNVDAEADQDRTARDRPPVDAAVKNPSLPARSRDPALSSDRTSSRSSRWYAYSGVIATVPRSSTHHSRT
jgi:hypothetical protein